MGGGFGNRSCTETQRLRCDHARSRDLDDTGVGRVVVTRRGEERRALVCKNKNAPINCHHPCRRWHLVAASRVRRRSFGRR